MLWETFDIKHTQPHLMGTVNLHAAHIGRYLTI
jgi:hypothetical protein